MIKWEEAFLAWGLSKNNLTICQKTFSFGKPHSGTIWQIVPLQIVKLFLDKPLEWDYIKPSWNPWFSDSARLAFISGSSLIISSPDGRDKQIVADVGGKAGLAVPAPDGELIAYATFEDRPMKVRQDLKFWGGSTLWVIPTVPGAKASPVTGKHQDTTYCLRWLDNKQLVFDRIADESFYRRARLWKAQVSR